MVNLDSPTNEGDLKDLMIKNLARLHCTEGRKLEEVEKKIRDAYIEHHVSDISSSYLFGDTIISLQVSMLTHRRPTTGARTHTQRAEHLRSSPRASSASYTPTSSARPRTHASTSSA